MQAIEFEAFVNHKAVYIPKQYQFIDNVKVKVIVLYKEHEIKCNYKKHNLIQAFSKAKQKGVFKNITDSLIWQKQLRDEWE